MMNLPEARCDFQDNGEQDRLPQRVARLEEQLFVTVHGLKPYKTRGFCYDCHKKQAKNPPENVVELQHVVCPAHGTTKYSVNGYDKKHNSTYLNRVLRTFYPAKVRRGLKLGKSFVQAVGNAWLAPTVRGRWIVK